MKESNLWETVIGIAVIVIIGAVLLWAVTLLFKLLGGWAIVLTIGAIALIGIYIWNKA